MKKIIVSFLICCAYLTLPAQNGIQKVFPTAAYTLQYAGSIGFLSGGYFRQTKTQKIELGLMYGYTPALFGGPLNSFTLKFIYNPFKIHLFSSRFCFEPIQTGLFVAAWFGENVDVAWSGRYPRGYYWWQSSMRKHIFASTQFSFVSKSTHVDRMSVYFEVNTNDLYLYNYVPNMETIKLYDIIFYGIGCKIYMK